MNTLFRSIRHKFIALVLLTTFCALSVAGVVFLLVDMDTYRRGRLLDMETQIELLAYSTAPALHFDDPQVAKENLDLLEIRPTVEAAAIFDARGNLFASYARSGEVPDLPAEAGDEGVTISGDDLIFFKPIIRNGEVLGTAYMRSEYMMRERVMSFIRILALVAGGAMTAAALISLWLQSFITKPILAIADITRSVISHKDYSRRAQKLTDDEVGVLVDGFNEMLDEIKRRTVALENTNLELKKEVAERKLAREEVLRLNNELKARVQELREASRNKDDFLATLAHELRNPLAPIRSGLDVLRLAGEENREEIYAILERQTNQLIHLVNDLMDVSRISRAKVRLKKRDVSLEEVIQGAIEGSRDLMEQKQHHFQVKLPDEPVLLHADPVRLTQVFVNLLSNAAHYTPPGGTIIFSAQCDGRGLEVCVEDNGIGMTPDMLERIFEPFTQANDPAHHRTQGGLGIGLTLARALMDLHQGTIRAESDGEGKGTRFFVLLPLGAMQPLLTD